MPPLVLATNVQAGTADEDSVAEAVAALEVLGEVLVRVTREESDLVAAVREAAGGTLVVAGGDGSLHQAVNILAREDLLERTTVGLVPLGTGNDFARGAGIPLEPAQAAALVVRAVDAEPRAVDLLVDDDGTIVVNGVHMGVGAQASEAAEAFKPRLGRLGYAVGALVAGLRPEFIKAEVCVDGELVVRSGRHLAQVAVGNGTTVGGGTALTPEADLGDGQLDVMVSFAVGPVSRFLYVLHLRRGRHHRRHDVRYVRGTRAEVTGPRLFTSADGEITGPHHHRTWTVRPGALRMLLP